MTTNVRYSNTPVEVGMLRYVGDGEGGISAHIILDLLPKLRVWDAEEQHYRASYPYTVRRATPAEESAYLAYLDANGRRGEAWRAA